MDLSLLRNFAFLTLLISFTLESSGNHIVGGELQMNKTGSVNTFEIRLVQFWDANNLVIPGPTNGGNRDEEADIYFYQKSNNKLMGTMTLRYRSSESIAFQNKACATSRSLSVSAGIYTGTITLNSSEYVDPGGYYITWERCCRNADINNIKTPGDNGMVFYLEFPPLSLPNSSPAFVIPNGQYICANRPFTMKMSASDADGDELRYSLVDPMRGNTTPGEPFLTSAIASPYPLVTWETGISIANVIPGPSPLRISNSGELTVTAGSIGLYVFAVQVEEFRNGKRIGLIRRDFQLLVIDCNDDQPAQPVIMHNDLPAAEITFCPESPVQLVTETSQDWSYQWQLNGLNIPGATGSTIMVKDSGTYSVIKSYTKKCSRDTTSQLVRAAFAKPIEAIISADRDILCAGKTMMMRANGGSLASGQQLTWARNNLAIANENATMEIAEAGTYTLTITNENVGCKGVDTLTIGKEELRVSLPARKGMLEGSRTTLSPVLLPPDGNHSYLWSPAYGLVSDPTQKEAIVAPFTDTTYTLTVTTENGCIYEAATEVYVIDKMHIPTAFSPNHDGQNDTFEIFNGKDQIVEVRIYNRWGALIFMSSGYPTPWNGTYKEEPVPAGSYPYVIKTAEMDLTGTVLLLK
ncbi:gliding motility-associated C-terminal domain-containing protein [Dyadobacter sp. UC 10]|nr:gliding motility-associated C-terminal domain-containing protein [Dyadobacter sp. UC 10]